MALSQLGSVPKNQLDALPLYTASQAAAGGTVSFNLGGGITRYFSETVLGISAASRVVSNTRNVIVSNYIDVSGCRAFACQIRRVTANPAAAIIFTYTLYMQYRFSSIDSPPAGAPATVGAFNIAKSSLNTATANNTFPDPALLANATNLHCWSQDEVVGSAGVSAFMGSDVRLIIDWDTNDPGAGNQFSMTLWGTS